LSSSATILNARFQSTRPRGARPAVEFEGGVTYVSIHAPAGGATYDSARANKKDSFNPRARGGRDQSSFPVLKPVLFQSTRPRGARRSQHVALNSKQVSIHAPAGGATQRLPASNYGFCFNPRARGGRDLPVLSTIYFIFVSIHAPAGGATQCYARNPKFVAFQSTRPRGARLGESWSQSLRRVSIHAPAGGATRDERRWRSAASFNPRARGGRDGLGQIKDRVQQFQSTRPRGARRWLCQH